MDDIIFGCENTRQHETDLEKVMNCLRAGGFRTEPNGCNFFRSRVQFMGHMIDSMGLHSSDDKLKAMRDKRLYTKF